MTYRHTPGHPVADIYAEYPRVSEPLSDLQRDILENFFGPRRDNPHDRPDQGAHAVEHPIAARRRVADNRNYRSVVEEAYADGGLDPEDESLPEAVKSNLRRIWDEEENHQTPVPPHVWDIYAELDESKNRLEQAMSDSRKQWERITARGKASVAARLDSVASFAEHPSQAEEGWFGGTDSESDDPGGWAR